MRFFRVIYTILLFVGCNLVHAENNVQAEKKSVYIDHYGIVDAIYTDESRVVISDANLQYNHASVYFNAQGRRVRGIKSILRVGVPVTYHYYQKSAENLLLKDVKIISMREYSKQIKGRGER